MDFEASNPRLESVLTTAGAGRIYSVFKNQCPINRCYNLYKDIRQVKLAKWYIHSYQGNQFDWFQIILNLSQSISHAISSNDIVSVDSICFFHICISLSLCMYSYTGFPIKDTRYSKLKNILFLLSDEKEGQIIENIDFKYLRNRASFVGNPVFAKLYIYKTLCSFIYWKNFVS